MKTRFQIRFAGFTDEDAPLSYQIMIYLSEEQYWSDITSSQTQNQNVLTEFAIGEQFSFYLPSGLGTTNELVVQGRVSDALGGIQNMTQKIKVVPNPNLLQSINLNSYDAVYDFALAIELSHANCSDAHNQTINKKLLFDKLNLQKDRTSQIYLHQ